jgi:thiamine-phosphate pyrophosphorylase
MCLTQDGTGLAHSEQARRLCAGGARFIQLRMKGAARDHWLEEARLAAGICRAHGALLVVNDSVEIALESGAHGVHLGARDGDWREARRWLGPALLVGGTVNVLADARRAASSGSLDYVGVGPLRYTATKRDLSPVLGIAGAARLIAALEGLPAWVIGGVAPADLPALHGAGAAGVAVSSYLYREGRIEENLRALAEAWPATDPAPIS